MKIDSGPLHQPYRILGLDTIRSRRSLADAVDLLRSHAISSNPSRGRFEVAPLFLSSGATVHLVSVHFKNDDDSVDIVPLPSCTHFKAVPVGGSETEKFPVGRLVDAIIEPPMRVRLADGTKLQSFEVIAAPLPLAPTEQQWKIVHGVLAAFGLKQCYRSLREAAQCPDVPDYHFLDCSCLADLTLPKLNEICYRLTRLDRSFANIPEQTIANALRIFGMRVPLRGRANTQHCHI